MIESEDEEDDDDDDDTGNKSDEGEGTLKNRPPALLPQDVLNRLAVIAAQSNENDDDDDESDESEGAEPPPGNTILHVKEFDYNFHVICSLSILFLP